jgi:hypothetical protein
MILGDSRATFDHHIDILKLTGVLKWIAVDCDHVGISANETVRYAPCIGSENHLDACFMRLAAAS